MKPRTPASLFQVQRYGAVAAVLREAMARRGISSADLIRTLGVGTGTVSGWTGAKTGVSRPYRAKLAQLLGVPEAALDWRSPTPPPLVETTPAPPAPRRVTTDVLSFVVGDNGQARLRLDLTLPVDRAMPLLRMLLDANVVFAPGHD